MREHDQDPLACDDPVFIVGAPRSGTTLLAALLGGHSRIACGPETQFFYLLPEIQLERAVADRRWPARAVELLASLMLEGQRVIDLFEMPEAEIERFLRNRPAAVRPMLEALTATYAARAGKPRWAEKTPNHILALDAIRASWPRAHIIRIVRDPRDSALSMRRLPWTSDSLLANCQLWNDWYEAGRRFFASDPLSTTIRLEDLVRAPEQRVAALCEFIGEEYEPSMLDTSSSGRAVASPAEPWKADVARPIDAGRVFGWKSALSPDLAVAASTHCQDGIREFGYEPVPPAPATLPVYRLDRLAIEQNEPALVATAQDGLRVVRSRHRTRDDTLLLLPVATPLRPRSVTRTVKLAAILLTRRLARRKTFYTGVTLREREPASMILARLLGAKPVS